MNMFITQEKYTTASGSRLFCGISRAIYEKWFNNNETIDIIYYKNVCVRCSKNGVQYDKKCTCNLTRHKPCTCPPLYYNAIYAQNMLHNMIKEDYDRLRKRTPKGTLFKNVNFSLNFQDNIFDIDAQVYYTIYSDKRIAIKKIEFDDA